LLDLLNNMLDNESSKRNKWMNEPSGISRRLQQCVERLQTRDFEGALVNLFPAIDKTAKKRRPKEGVGARIRAFLKDEEVLISAIGTGNVFAQISINGVTIPDALYKFGRTPIAHEGELDPRLHFNDSGSVEIGVDRWNLPSGYVTGMSMAVVVAPENLGERISDNLGITIFGHELRVNDLWGQRDKVQQIVCEKFRNPHLFET
jgi:hypothetical protein